ncbi:arylesterase [Agrobacterium radiobacter]|uniref:Multifunctional: acyl-CoA thioesterase I protease I lysophospholipaseL(I) n=1 Tax=Agrobacterium tumefaciens str. B6 TaxID=1183423 RepID=A0A822V0K7_AGRTU|nr:arylesterase [Agrobacterium tumefaciens]AYM06575.1 acyl-CoA thioesterase [Agrobacterium tumefaciens]KWT82304.1 arylesterase [Agrobacterium tumefaciens str. B6]MQB25592.1 arylesterase [Agrobacterium tumefaciens]NSZ33590.1 arylesterase [Agrobacterium tumefaciens]NTA06200.1 arylesterase [Agrobacterium tumefaciens]
MRFKAALFHFIVIFATAFSATVVTAQERTWQLVGLGDSLMAGYQLPPTDSYTAQLEAALKGKGVNVAIANAGVSGDTSSGGLARAEWSVPDGTDGVILELGANDALRGIPPEQTEKNIDTIISGFQKRNIAVLLVGIMAPPNMGEDYAKRFNPIFPKLAEKYNLPLYPFFLDGVVTDDALNLDDKMHPNTRGVAMMVEKSLPAVESFIKTIGAQKK